MAIIPLRGLTVFVALLVVYGCSESSNQSGPQKKIQNETSWYNPSFLHAVFGGFEKTQPLYLVGNENLAQLRVQGEYLVKGPGACGSCHARDAGNIDSPLTGGRMMSDRFGLAAAANITPDLETGIGLWNIAEVVQALRSSIGREGKALSLDLHHGYRWLSDRDAYAIAIYLFATKAVNNLVERRELGGWERRRWGLFSQHQQFVGYVPALRADEQWQYGRYLSHNVARCRTCHTAGGGEGGEFLGTSGRSLSTFSKLRRLFEAISDDRENPAEVVPYLSSAAREDYLKSEMTQSTDHGAKVVLPSAEQAEQSADQAIDTGLFPILGPNIRGLSQSGLYDWTLENIVTYLSSGRMPSGAVVDGRFCPWPYFQKMKEGDKLAIARYLKRLE